MSAGGLQCPWFQHFMSETAHILNMSGAVLIQCRMVIFGSLHSTQLQDYIIGNLYSKYVSRGTRWHKKRDGRKSEKREKVEIQ